MSDGGSREEELMDERRRRDEFFDAFDAFDAKSKAAGMREYLLTDDQGDSYSYEASDLPMALVVHQQLYGTNIQKAEEI